jgi:hypothetical protein
MSGSEDTGVSFQTSQEISMGRELPSLLNKSDPQLLDGVDDMSFAWVDIMNPNVIFHA